MWIFPWIKLSWHSGYKWDKRKWLNWFWQFPSQGLSSYSTTHMHGPAVYVKEGLLFAWDLSLENSVDSHCFWLALLHSVSYFFPSINHIVCLYVWFCFVFMHNVHAISSNIDEVLSINSFGNRFVFWDFPMHHKDWLTYSGC